MQKTKVKVIFTEKAFKSILNIILHIAEKGYPERAEKYMEKLFDFGYSLSVFPEKYPVCRQKYLARREMHCAVFNKTYIFVYKVIKNTLVIYNIIHVKTHSDYYSVK